MSINYRRIRMKILLNKTIFTQKIVGYKRFFIYLLHKGLHFTNANSKLNIFSPNEDLFCFFFKVAASRELNLKKKRALKNY